MFELLVIATYTLKLFQVVYTVSLHFTIEVGALMPTNQGHVVGGDECYLH